MPRSRTGNELKLLKDTRLKPGVYIGSRRIYNRKKGIGTPIGRHQFFLLIPRNPENFEGVAQDIGGGQKGIIVGAYNVKGKGFFSRRKLEYRRNSPSDTEAMQYYFLKNTTGEKGPWDTHLSRSLNPGRETDGLIQKVMEAADRYEAKTQQKPVKYPGLLPTIMGRGQNSNTWVQSIADSLNMKHRRRDFPGFDSGADLRMPTSLFQSSEKEAFLDGYLKESNNA
jgi:hypothetical protein